MLSYLPNSSIPYVTLNINNSIIHWDLRTNDNIIEETEVSAINRKKIQWTKVRASVPHNRFALVQCQWDYLGTFHMYGCNLTNRPNYRYSGIEHYGNGSQAGESAWASFIGTGNSFAYFQNKAFSISTGVTDPTVNASLVFLDSDIGAAS